MQMKLSRWFAGIVGIVSTVGIASAHPGHAPTDLAAQISQPFAGLDYFLVFVALTSVLLVGLRVAVKLRSDARNKAQ